MTILYTIGYSGMRPEQLVVTVLPDTGERYLSLG